MCGLVKEERRERVVKKMYKWAPGDSGKIPV
jgi:hypothetical protein